MRNAAELGKRSGRVNRIGEGRSALGPGSIGLHALQEKTGRVHDFKVGRGRDFIGERGGAKATGNELGLRETIGERERRSEIQRIITGSNQKYGVVDFRTQLIAHEAPLCAADVVRPYREAIRDETRVLVLPYIDNWVGLRHPVRAIAEAARARGVEYIAVDGAQAVGMLPVDVNELDVDFYATSAHKWLQAPKGTGLLFLRRQHLPSVVASNVTWGQRRWSESARKFEDFGTRDHSKALALGQAIDFQEQLGGDKKQSYYRQLWNHCQARVAAGARLRWCSPPPICRRRVALLDRDRRP